MSTGTQATDPELDEALARAIRQLIAVAIAAGEAAGAVPGPGRSGLDNDLLRLRTGLSPRHGPR